MQRNHFAISGRFQIAALQFVKKTRTGIGRDHFAINGRFQIAAFQLAKKNANWNRPRPLRQPRLLQNSSLAVREQITNWNRPLQAPISVAFFYALFYAFFVASALCDHSLVIQVGLPRVGSFSPRPTFCWQANSSPILHSSKLGLLQVGLCSPRRDFAVPGKKHANNITAESL